MNLHLGVYLRFSGPTEELRPLLEKIGTALIEEGYGSDKEADVLNSMIVVSESKFGRYEKPKDFLESVLSQGLIVVIPTKEEDADTGD